jgi:uncharacterized protein
VAVVRRTDLEAPEVRVLGCLIEKQLTTPDAYPLTLNSLRLACNQSTNRDPVVDYDDAAVRVAAERLARRGLARFASGRGSRAAKYRHMLRDELSLADDELALLGLLMLRGPQTPGELKARGERMYRFDGLDGAQDALRRLVDRDLVRRLERSPGQKEERYAHRLSEDADDHETDQGPPAATGPPPPAEGRLDRIERELAELHLAVEELRRRGRDLT